MLLLYLLGLQLAQSIFFYLGFLKTILNWKEYLHQTIDPLLWCHFLGMNNSSMSIHSLLCLPFWIKTWVFPFSNLCLIIFLFVKLSLSTLFKFSLYQYPWTLLPDKVLSLNRGISCLKSTRSKKREKKIFTVSAPVFFIGADRVNNFGTYQWQTLEPSEREKKRII